MLWFAFLKRGLGDGDCITEILFYVSHRIHVWYIYLHLVDFMVNVGKYISPMDGMGMLSDKKPT